MNQLNFLWRGVLMTTFFTVLVTTLGCLGGTVDSRVLEASFSIVLMLLSAKSLLPMEKNELEMESGEEGKNGNGKNGYTSSGENSCS